MGVDLLAEQVEDEEGLFQPAAVMIVGPDGGILGTHLGRPEDVLEMSAMCLARSIESPMFGRPHAPDRLRVDSEELASALRASQPQIEVVVGRTPELAVLFDRMKEELGELQLDSATYLSPGVEALELAPFFRATAAFYRAAPWRLAVDDRCLFLVSAPKLGLEEAAVTIVGAQDEQFGFVVFEDLDALDAFVESADALEGDDVPYGMPTFLSMNFERGEEIPESLREEITANDWEIAGPDAYPWVVRTEDLQPHLPTRAELACVEAIAAAVTHAMADEDPLRAAWEGGASVAGTVEVDTLCGPIEVAWRAALDEGPEAYSGDHFEDLAALERVGDLDSDLRRIVEYDLLGRFQDSAFAAGVTMAGVLAVAMDLAATRLGVSIASLTPDDLETLLFDVFPEEVTLRPEEAPEFIRDLRAFFGFLEREFDRPGAGACRAFLDARVERRMSEELADASLYAPAKEVIMRGYESGYDMDSQEGFEAWMRLQARTSPPQAPTQAAKPAKGAAAKKKDKRKQARKARKRNR